MHLKVLVQNSLTNDLVDISSLILNASWSTQIDSQPGVLKFEYVFDSTFSFPEGSAISLYVEEKRVFYGYLFERTITQNASVACTAYDQLRYLKNKDTIVAINLTASQLFGKICDEFELPYSIVDNTSWVTVPRIHDNKSLFEMIQDSIDNTLVNTGSWYIIRDNAGVLEFVSLNSLRTDLFIGDESLLLDYNYTVSIDKDSYSQVKLIKENKQTVKREVYKVFDSDRILQWGTLQYFEKMDEKANPAQIAHRAEQLLRLKSRATKTLNLTCLGDLRVSSGNSVVLDIKKLADEEVTMGGYFIVVSCTHNFRNSEHTMELELAMESE